jgi:hypothetical protein
MLEVLLEGTGAAFATLFILSWPVHGLRFKALDRQKPVYVSALGFAVGWELVGTGYAWSYPGFNLYALNGVPVALLLGWPLWLTSAAVVVEAVLGHSRTSTPGPRKFVLVATVGTLVGFLVELTGVGLGWWAYLQPLSPSWSIFAFSGYVHVITFAGWGLIAVVITLLADAVGRPRSRIGAWRSLALLFLISVPVGVSLFLFLGLTYLALPWSR